MTEKLSLVDMMRRSVWSEEARQKRREWNAYVQEQWTAMLAKDGIIFEKKADDDLDA